MMMGDVSGTVLWWVEGRLGCFLVRWVLLELAELFGRLPRSCLDAVE